MSERLETQQELETLKAWKSSSDSEKTALSAQVASLEVSWQWNRWKVEQQFIRRFDTFWQQLRQALELQSEIHLMTCFRIDVH